MANIEKTERDVKLQLDTKSLLNIVNNIGFESGNIFEFSGTMFYIVMFPEDELDENEDAWYANSTAISGYDIYILETLPNEEKKRRLFHETAERSYRSRGISQDKAHKLAFRDEQAIFGERR